MATVFQKVWRKGEFASPDEVHNVPNSHSFFVHEAEISDHGRDFIRDQYGFTDEQMDAFEACVDRSADDAYMAKKSFKVVVETIDD